MTKVESFVSKNSRDEIFVIQLNPENVEPPDPKAVPVDFETAITKTGFGCFNVYVIFTCCICCITSMAQTSTMSMIFPRAQCDLHLSLADKGTLNATTYVGMILSAIMWGFIADIQGRRKILCYGNLATFVCDIFCGLSQNFWTLAFGKFCGGFISCGPFAVMMTYTSEIMPMKYRARVLILLGASFSLSNILIPGLSWLVLPMDWDWKISEYFVIHPWNLFLLIMAIPSLLGGLLFHFVPESPKFLMSRGLNKEALAVFQEIYRRNHNRDEFPIKALVNEKFVVSTHDGKCEVEAQKTPEDNIAHPVHRSLWTAFKAGLAQMATIFEGPYLKNCILVFTMQVGFLWSQNTMRLWLPSILGMISNYYDHAKGAAEETSFDLCNVIEWSTGAALKETNSTEPVVCSQVVDGSIYLNTITMGMVGLCGYAVAGIIMNAVSQRHIILFASLLAAILGSFISSAPSKMLVVLMFSTYVSLGGVVGSSMVALAVTLVPTQLRTMTVSLMMMFGRTGSIFGNLLFPQLLSLGCHPPFLTMAAILVFCGLLCLALPKSAQVPLK